jgi:hypothetical protein
MAARHVWGASALVVLLSVSCGLPNLDLEHEAGVPIGSGETDDADLATDDDETGSDVTGSDVTGSDVTGNAAGDGTGGGGRADATEDGNAHGDEDDPFDDIEWALPPAGPGSPSVNEDSIYKVLDDLDPQACDALLDPTQGWFDPSTFGTGSRSVHLFKAGAQLCAGDRAAAVVSYGRALEHEWSFAVEQPLHSRVCNVWDAVTRMIEPGAGPCALEELSFDELTDDGGPSDPAAPSEDSRAAEPGTEGPQETNPEESAERGQNEDSEVGDDGSSP